MRVQPPQELVHLNVAQQPSNRLSHLDWLRIFVIAELILFHTAMTFAPYGWYIRNPQLNLATQALVQVLDKFHMELLFFIAGVAAWYSFGVRKWGTYLLERLQRLVVPFIFGMLVIVPPCYYFSQLFFDRFFSLTYNNFFDWYVKFWLGKAVTPFSVMYGGAFRAGALWFLWYLVVYTFVLFPFLYLIYHKAREKFIPRLASFFDKRGALLLLVIPIVLVNIFSQWKVSIGGTNFRIIGWVMVGDFQVLYYVLFLVYGFFIYSNARFQKGIDKTGLIAIPIALISMVLFMLLVFPTWNNAPLKQFWYTFRGEPGTRGFIMSQSLYAVTTWSWVLSLLYLGRKFLNRSGRFVRWGNEAVLPVYIVHSTFIAILSYYVVKWNMPVLPKYVIIVVLTYIGCVALLQLCKTNNITRFVLGIRLKKTLR
ncbi:MAG: acyltransferase [Dehalococcoidia bacterium]|nr:acyltransferase [Dehalococcoidia bacterium]